MRWPRAVRYARDARFWVGACAVAVVVGFWAMTVAQLEQERNLEI